MNTLNKYCLTMMDNITGSCFEILDKLTRFHH